jgi:hypothetical protein
VINDSLGDRMKERYENRNADRPTVKQVAIMSGGDWTDAGITHLALPVSVKLACAEKEYDEWRRSHSYMSFPNWLRKFKEAVDSSVEEYWEG